MEAVQKLVGFVGWKNFILETRLAHETSKQKKTLPHHTLTVLRGITLAATLGR